MATHTAPLTDAAWTAKDALLTDTIANEVYASHYSERRLSRFVIGALSFTLLGSFAAIVSLAHKPTQNRYIRIDEMGRAQAIQYSGPQLQPARGRSTNLPHRLGQLSLHPQQRHGCEEVPAQLLLSVPAACLADDDPGQQRSSRLAGYGWAGGTERRGRAERHHHHDVR